MDAATASLDRILKGDEYTVIPSVPVFDEHDEHDADGKLVRKFDRKALQKIVDTCNKRAKETGDLSPFGPGHTIADAPEEKQPVTYGYAVNFKVGNYGPEKKLGILADFYVKKTVTRSDGQSADGLTEVKSFPRRSIELWLKDGFIDHIALLRRTPQRDLGLLEFAKGHAVEIPSTDNLFLSPNRQGSLAAAVRRGKLCYSMESNMPLDQQPAMTPPDDQNGDQFDPNGDEHKQFCKHADHYIKSKYGDGLKQYEMATGSPGGDNTFVPGDDNGKDKKMDDLTMPPKAKDDDDVVKMARQFASADEKVKVAQYERLLQRLKAVETQGEDQKRKFSEDDAENRVNSLVGRGWVMDSKREKLEFMKLPLGKDRDERGEYIQKFYQRDMFNAAPIAGPLVDTNGPSGKRNYNKAEVDKAVEYATANGLSDLSVAFEKLYGGK